MTYPMLRTLLVGAALAAYSAGCGCPDPEPWTPAFDATDEGWFLSTWGPSPDDQYAVGGTDAGGHIFHKDASGWSKIDTGLGALPIMNWVFGFSESDITVVGEDGVIIHFDGLNWTRQDSGTDKLLWGVWGSSPSDLWAVGGAGLRDGDEIILRFDGAAWREVPAPAIETANVNAFFKVWGTGPDNVYIVGQRGLILHYTGGELRQELVETTRDLISLWGTGPDRIAVVGGRANGVVTYWDGSTWSTVELVPLPGLNGVWFDNENAVHTVGTEGTLATLSFGGGVVTEEAPFTRSAFHAVFGDSSGRLTAVGGNLGAVGVPQTGLAYSRPERCDE